MPRRCGLAAALFLAFITSAFADDQAIWREYGLVSSQSVQNGRVALTTYRMKDLTGALAAWEWLRSPKGRPCDLAQFCTADGSKTVITEDNYVFVFEGGRPTKAQVADLLKTTPNKQGTSLPAIITFVPRQGLVPDSARYVLGPASLAAFAPELGSTNPGFAEGAEAQVADYRVGRNGAPEHLALFYYASPEQARQHAAAFKQLPGAHVKRSDVLVAVAYGPATDAEAEALLSRVQYEAKITWNEVPPPSPLKPLYQMLVSIMYISILLCALCLVAGLMYAGMRIYRRRYGTLESDEAMTTLHLTSDLKSQ
jgi:hypothetical protein